MHKLDCFDIDDHDEINGEVQLVRVWCTTHGRYEWHSVPRDMVEDGGSLILETKPVEW